jgi:hypothetical protein
MYAPVPEAPAYLQVYPQKMHPARSVADEFFQVNSHEYQQGLMSLIDVRHVAHEALLPFFGVHAKMPNQTMCFLLYQGKCKWRKWSLFILHH